jgi:DNA-binding NarL/FixJ family response regulator
MVEAARIRLLIASPHTLIRHVLARLIADRTSLQLVGDVGNRLQAISVAAKVAPNVILLEPVPGTDLSLDAVEPLGAAAGPQARILVLTGLADTEIHRQALRLGVRGIVDLDHSPTTFFRAIEQVHNGDVWMQRRLMADLLTSATGGSTSERARIESLTTREREVVRLMSEGLKNKQIAERLSIADVTVRHHLTSIFSKLEVSDRLSLVVFAFHHGLSSPRVPWHKEPTIDGR